MEKTTNRFSLKNISYAFLIILLVFGIVKTAFDISLLISKRDQVNSDRVSLVDTFLLQGKVDYLRSSKRAHNGYEFKSNNGYYFSITKSSFEGIIDKNDLENHLNHHGQKLIIYSNKETLNRYLSSTIPIGIKVLQIQIANKKYIDIKKGNSIFRKKLLFVTITELLLTAAFFLLFVKRKKLHLL